MQQELGIIRQHLFPADRILGTLQGLRAPRDSGKEPRPPLMMMGATMNHASEIQAPISSLPFSNHTGREAATATATGSSSGSSQPAGNHRHSHSRKASVILSHETADFLEVVQV